MILLWTLIGALAGVGIGTLVWLFPSHAGSRHSFPVIPVIGLALIGGSGGFVVSLIGSLLARCVL